MTSSETDELEPRAERDALHPRLVLVYNANAGLLSGAVDFLHKTFSPATYPCQLCAISYGPLGMKRRWKAFLDSLGLPLLFLHKDEFAGPEPLPAIFLETVDGRETLVSAKDFGRISSLDALESALRAALAER
jgi:hypothetical protein